MGLMNDLDWEQQRMLELIFAIKKSDRKEVTFEELVNEYLQRQQEAARFTPVVNDE